MRRKYLLSACILNFSRWNRHGYAIFASLGKQVRIAFLPIHICEMALKKSFQKGVIIHILFFLENSLDIIKRREKPKVWLAAITVATSRVEEENFMKQLDIFYW